MFSIVNHIKTKTILLKQWLGTLGKLSSKTQQNSMDTQA